MPTQFIYQPHIYADGMVITPDLPLSTVWVLCGDEGPNVMSPKRLSTDLVLQTALPEPVARPAMALIAASEGALAVPALLVVEPFGDQSAFAGGDIALSRQAFRLKDCAPDMAPAMRGKRAEVCGIEAALREGEGGEGMLPYGTLVCVAGLDGVPAKNGRYEVALSNGNGATLTHKVDIERLW